MEILGVDILNALKTLGLNGEREFFIVLIVLITALCLKERQALITEHKLVVETNSISSKNLMDHINILNNELEKTRVQLTDLHNQNLELMEKIREANKKISELENALVELKNSRNNMSS